MFRKMFFFTISLVTCAIILSDRLNAAMNMQANLTEKAFVIVTASYNNANWYRNNLDSVISQKYTNFRIIYVDDNSPDGTGEFVETYIHAKNLESKITLIRNTKRLGILANEYKAIHLCSPDEIVIILDGDDWLAHENVLNRLNQEYTDPDVWLTYGQFMIFYGENKPLGMGFSAKIPDCLIHVNATRKNPGIGAPSHLRTFYAGLFHQIKIEDLLYNGNFFTAACDVASMTPMIEMAATHCRFIPDILCIYNRANSLNIDKIHGNLQYTLDRTIRSWKKYEPVASYKDLKLISTM